MEQILITKILNYPKYLYRWCRGQLIAPIYLVERTWQAYRHGKDLTCIQDNTDRITASEIILFCTLRNESIRIPWFLDYYRALGVGHFVFVDNDSDDGFMGVVSGHDDVSVWHTTASYRDSNFGMHWLNTLLRRHGSGHWCMTCDADEFLVFPHMDSRNLHELGAYLESTGRRSMACIMLDMYSDAPVARTHYNPGDNPFLIAPFFDGNGYVQEPGWLDEIKVKGGVRRRHFFRETPAKAPSIHKTPFVKWRWPYSYFLSMHQLLPPWLNIPHDEFHNAPTGCIMHFKYFDILRHKVEEEMDRKQHWNDSFEYRQYHEQLDSEHECLTYEHSVRYRNWQQLVSKGFMNQGLWF